ncbi:MAG: MotA/TolQ/ExbB proton channel family protein, partial [Rubripirellula sp.]|nr:MotA/TolQ/ExbB proton channel family protein [Rubripirellula sp.]
MNNLLRKSLPPRCGILIFFTVFFLSIHAHCVAQDESSGDDSATENLSVNEGEIRDLLADTNQTENTVPEPTSIDLLSLIMRGGAFMIPIGIMSLMVVTLAVERMLHLRRDSIMPRKLEQEISLLNSPPETFNPSAAYSVCNTHPSATSRIILSMLVRTGQPLQEIERAGLETAQREIDKCVSPIRWLTLAGAATPLMGLLGTVWGMIVAFHESTTLTPDRSRSEQLSEGIYTALTTTLAGLAVAIPAAILALYLENRLLKIFHAVEDFTFQ